jgi:hypothetical protein
MVMLDVIQIVVTERQWEELKGLMGTVSHGPVSIGEHFFPPLKCTISSLRLERVGCHESYHVQLHLSMPSEPDDACSLLPAHWPEWLEASVVETSGGLLETSVGKRPTSASAAIARLFL